MPRFDPLPERRPAIVAGASSGIGEATAIELASHGFPVALGARRVEKLDEIVGKIRADGGEAVGFHLDVTDPGSVKSFVSQSVEALGEIEVLVAGAGDTYFGKLADISTDEFDSQMQIHLVGANRLAELIGPPLEDWAKWGQARHDYFLRAADLARAITFVAETPRGGFIANMELQPEAPLADNKTRQQLALGEEGMPGL